MATSTKNVHGLFIHGVGEQKAGYSRNAQTWLSAAMQRDRARKGAQLYGQEVLWAPVLDRYQEEMLDSVRKRGSKNRPMQRLVIGTLADALCYQNRRDEILELIDVAYGRLRDTDGVTFFAHSLGCLIATDWLRSRGKVRVAGMHTFGCNLELFSLGGKFSCPPQLLAAGKWTSYFDPTDMLGWPIAGFVPQVRDVEVEVGGLLGATGLAHTQYWEDGDFWRDSVASAL